MTRKIFAAIVLCIVFVCAILGLIPRVRLEAINTDVAILADYREISALAKNSGLNVLEAIEMLKQNGLTGLMVSELTGDNISHGLGWAEFTITRDPERGTEGTVISILPNSPHKDLLNHWLRVRFSIKNENHDNSPIFLPLSVSMLKTVGIIPDIDGLEAAKKSGLPIYYRPAPSPGTLPNNAAEMLKLVHEKYHVAVFTPAGEVVSGYPDVSALANVAKDFGIPLAVVEFSRQMGEKNLNELVSPMLMPLHSVTNEEMMSRNITRVALRDRLIRAAVERSVRLLLLRTAPQNTTNFSFKDFSSEMNLLARALGDHNFSIKFPEVLFRANPPHPFRGFVGNILASFAVAAMLSFAFWRYFTRMGLAENSRTKIIFAIAALVLTILCAKVSFVARIACALLAPMIAVEAALLAMDYNKNRSLIQGFAFVLVGGLAVAAFYSLPEYMLRLRAFSGVKATLIIPPVLVILHDFKRRIHPESILEFLSRPPFWGELILCGILAVAIGLMIFRSGNVAIISSFESRMRDTLENLLIARPRTRETFIGYPSLLLLNFLVSRNYLARYREILRVGVVIGFSSVINSFCHFHTPLLLTLLREFNGLWTGLLFGLILVVMIRFVLIPVLRILKPLFS